MPKQQPEPFEDVPMFDLPTSWPTPKSWPSVVRKGGSMVVVYGTPAPQGSKSFKGTSKAGKGIMIESNKPLVDRWRGDVVMASRAIVEQAPQLYPLDGPLEAIMVFSLRRPPSHYRTGRNAHLIRDAAPARPTAKPDLSKLLRSTEDALKTSGFWKDDALVVEYSRAAKVFCGEDPSALDVPGAIIIVKQIQGEQ